MNKFRKQFFVKEQSTYHTAAGTFDSQHSMKLTISLDEFGGNEKAVHQFDLDESEDGIGYDMIIGRDLMTALDLDVRFSDNTI